MEYLSPGLTVGRRHLLSDNNPHNPEGKIHHHMHKCQNKGKEAQWETISAKKVRSQKS